MRQALEQATPLAVARRRARHIRGVASADDTTLRDATCGLGADSMALVDSGMAVIASDRDADRVALAAWNLTALAPRSRPGSRFEVLRADALDPVADTKYLLLDPDRRPQGRKTLDPRRWSPSLEACLAAAARHAGACLKLAPSLEPNSMAPLPGPHRWEWTSLDGELAELTLWTGELAQRTRGEGDSGEAAGSVGSDRGERAAAVLRAGRAYTLHGLPFDVAPLGASAARDVRFVLDPDPAIVRSGLLGHIARRCGLAPLAPQLAYLAGDREPPPGPYSAWRVLASCSGDRKRVRAMLSAHGIGPLTVKKRGHPDSSQQLESRYRGSGQQHGFLIVARLESGHLALLVEPVPGAPAGR